MPSRFFLTALLGIGLLAVSAGDVAAQSRGTGMSSSQLDNLGLRQVWNTQLAINPLYSKMRHFTQVVSHDNAMVMFEVKHGGETRTFSSNDLDTFGRPLGEEGAQAQAEMYMARLDRSRGEPEMERHEVPTITFYVLSDNGILHAVDGRTGRVLWTQSHGSRHVVTQKAAANDELVVYISGNMLMALHRENGEIKWQRRLENQPAAGPELTDTKIMVPLTTGQVYIYDFDGGPGLARNYSSIGRVVTPVRATSTTVSWATDRGFFYVADSDRPRVRYRLEANGKIVAPSANFQHLYLYFTTTNGYVYCIFAPSGEIQWRHSTGEQIETSPITVGDSVYVTLRYGGLYKLGLTHGSIRWFAPGVRQFLSANDQYVYGLDALNRLMVMDAKTGSLVGSVETSGFDFFYTNHETDRIILGTNTGRLQVLRSAALPYPQIHVKMVRPATEEEEAEMADPQPRRPAPAAQDPFGDAADDPFGGPADDPFGGPPAAADPFGGPPAAADDPFGGPPAAEEDDPFGGPPASADPFGSDDDNPFGSGDDDNPFG